MSFHLELKNVKKQFGPTEIIRGVNLNVKKGEIHSLIGPNGAGKSTLYNLISGVYGLTSGSIRFNNKNIENLPSYEIFRLGLSRSFQITNIFPKMSVFENVRCGLLWNMNYKYSILKILDNNQDLNDKTNAGINCPEYSAFSVQYHPESSPGPHDSRYLFEKFIELMDA